MSAPRLGVIFSPQQPPERLRAVVDAAERSALDELWLWEDCFAEGGISAATAALAWTQRLQIGIGILPVPLRNVALTAMETATLSRLFPGRLHLGVGHGVLPWMEQVGARAESPMTLLREYAAALRALLAGETVTTDGRYVRLRDVTLDWPPAEPPAVHIGAIGPKTMALAEELGDGTVLTGASTADDVRRARAAAPGNRITSFLPASADPARIASDVVDLGAAGADAVEVFVTGDGGDAEQLVQLLDDGVRPLLRRAEESSP